MTGSSKNQLFAPMSLSTVRWNATVFVQVGVLDLVPKLFEFDRPTKTDKSTFVPSSFINIISKVLQRSFLGPKNSRFFSRGKGINGGQK